MSKPKPPRPTGPGPTDGSRSGPPPGGRPPKSAGSASGKGRASKVPAHPDDDDIDEATPPPLAKKPRKVKTVLRKRPPPSRGLGWRGVLAVVVLGLLLGVVATAMVLYGDAARKVTAWQDTPPATRPTTVWSAPMLLRQGEPVDADLLARDLRAAGYEPVSALTADDQFVRQGSTFQVRSKGGAGAGWKVGPATGKIKVEAGRVAEVEPKSGLQLRPTTLAVIGDLQARRSPVRLAEISPWMVPALLSIEDARFRDHPGVDPIGITRAVVANLLGRSEGGSTLTQQLAKNLFVGAQRTMRRKVEEAFLAAALERAFDKDALLELYLSEVYLGHADGMPIYGVAQAARAWFGRPPDRLTVAECATLAGVIASPNAWSPLRDAEAAEKRRNVVIDRMVTVRALTEAQADEARAEPLKLVPVDVGASWEAPWAVSAAVAAAGDALGETFRAGSGLAVFSTIQPHLQRAAEQALADGMNRLGAAEAEAKDAQAAAAVVRSDDGAVLAVVGGRDFKTSPFHRALSAWREAGSTIKPLTVLLALDKDPTLGPSTLLVDQPITRVHDGKRWTPRNYDGTYLGKVTLRRAVETSRNIPMVLLAEPLGWTALQGHLRNAGLTRATDLPSASLGGFPTTVVELAAAYTAFSEAGSARAPRLLLGVADADGRTLLDTEVTTHRLGSARSAALVRHLLEGVITDGTAHRAASLGIHGAFAGKTGTTDEARDAWFVGLDPEWVTAVWVGNDRGVLGLTGGDAALPVWASVMTALGTPRGRFGDPDDLIGVPVCARTGRPPCGSCVATRTEYFPRGQVPDADCSAPEPAEEAPPEVPSAEPHAHATAPPDAPAPKKPEVPHHEAATPP
jgi:penicillin-binding protein 1B